MWPQDSGCTSLSLVVWTQDGWDAPLQGRCGRTGLTSAHLTRPPEVSTSTTSLTWDLKCTAWVRSWARVPSVCAGWGDSNRTVVLWPPWAWVSPQRETAHCVPSMVQEMGNGGPSKAECAQGLLPSRDQHPACRVEVKDTLGRPTLVCACLRHFC